MKTLYKKRNYWLWHISLLSKQFQKSSATDAATNWQGLKHLIRSRVKSLPFLPISLNEQHFDTIAADNLRKHGQLLTIFIKLHWSMFKFHLFLAHLSFAQGELLWSPFVRRPACVNFFSSVTSGSIGIKLHRKHPLNDLTRFPSNIWDPCRILVSMATKWKKKFFFSQTGWQIFK